MTWINTPLSNPAQAGVMTPTRQPTLAAQPLHSGPGTEFTEFPDPARFSPELGESQFRSAARQSNEDPMPRLLSLHLHLPFDGNVVDCPVVTGVDRGRSYASFHRLARECELVAPLFDRDRDVVQLQLDGLTSETAGNGLGELLHAVSRHFFLSHASTREFLVVLPGGVHGARELAGMVDLGFNRVRFRALPVTADPAATALLERSLAAAREAGMRSTGLDLICGPAADSDADFEASLQQLLALRAERVRLSFPADPASLATATPRPDCAQRHAAAASALLAAGYEALGLDVFALPQDDLARGRQSGLLHHNALGYVPLAQTDLIGLGVGARSCIGDACFENYPELAAWESSIDMGELPIWRGLQLNADQRLRSDLLQALLCAGSVDLAPMQEQHGIVFAEYFRDELAMLQPLREAGLLRYDARSLQLGPQGRLALQAICAPFAALGHWS
ncbi:MAG: hypothetical protein JNN30_13525 [Rhodanobacteraceae bacterium]|nr:hypothetical protein [Rhodanobacteraceae bacterium]